MVSMQTNLELTRTQAERVLAAWLEQLVTCKDILRLKGGMVNSVLRLDLNWSPFSAVIKLNSAPAAFVAEARALRILHALTRFPCPQVYLHDGSASILPCCFPAPGNDPRLLPGGAQSAPG